MEAMTSTAEIYATLPTMNLPQLEELATELKELIDELKNADKEPINVETPFLLKSRDLPLLSCRQSDRQAFKGCRQPC